MAVSEGSSMILLAALCHALLGKGKYQALVLSAKSGGGKSKEFHAFENVCCCLCSLHFKVCA